MLKSEDPGARLRNRCSPVNPGVGAQVFVVFIITPSCTARPASHTIYCFFDNICFFDTSTFSVWLVLPCGWKLWDAYTNHNEGYLGLERWNLTVSTKPFGLNADPGGAVKWG